MHTRYTSFLHFRSSLHHPSPRVTLFAMRLVIQTHRESDRENERSDQDEGEIPSCFSVIRKNGAPSQIQYKMDTHMHEVQRQERRCSFLKRFRNSFRCGTSLLAAFPQERRLITTPPHPPSQSSGCIIRAKRQEPAINNFGLHSRNRIPLSGLQPDFGDRNQDVNQEEPRRAYESPCWTASCIHFYLSYAEA